MLGIEPTTHDTTIFRPRYEADPKTRRFAGKLLNATSVRDTGNFQGFPVPLGHEIGS